MAEQLHPLHASRARPTRCAASDVAHVEMVEQVTRGAQRGAVRRRRRVLARRRSCRRSTCARGSGSSRRPTTCRTRLLVVQRRRPQRRPGRRCRREFVSIRRRRRSSRPAQALTGLSGRYLDGVANIGDRLILVLDLAEVLSFERSDRWPRDAAYPRGAVMATRQNERPRDTRRAGVRHRAWSLAQAEQVDRRGRRDRAHHRRGVGRRRRAGALARRARSSGAERDGGVAEGDRRPGRVGRGVGRGAAVVGQRDGRVDRAGDGQHGQPGGVDRRDRRRRSRRRAASIQQVAGDGRRRWRPRRSR